jgi:hypothetical protein
VRTARPLHTPDKRSLKDVDLEGRRLRLESLWNRTDEEFGGQSTACCNAALVNETYAY